jgi:hypothetical protein
MDTSMIAAKIKDGKPDVRPGLEDTSADLSRAIGDAHGPTNALLTKEPKSVGS